MNRAKRVVNSIFSDNPVRLSEEVNAALLERAAIALQNKRMQVVSEMFDEGEFSTKQVKRSIAENKAAARAMVIDALVNEDFSLHPGSTKLVKNPNARRANDADSLHQMTKTQAGRKLANAGEYNTFKKSGVLTKAAVKGQKNIYKSKTSYGFAKTDSTAQSAAEKSTSRGEYKKNFGKLRGRLHGHKKAE